MFVCFESLTFQREEELRQLFIKICVVMDQLVKVVSRRLVRGPNIQGQVGQELVCPVFEAPHQLYPVPDTLVLEHEKPLVTLYIFLHARTYCTSQGEKIEICD